MREFIRKNPVMSVIGALIVGALFLAAPIMALVSALRGKKPAGGTPGEKAAAAVNTPTGSAG
jgi:hypothetical protein